MYAPPGIKRALPARLVLLYWFVVLVVVLVVPCCTGSALLVVLVVPYFFPKQFVYICDLLNKESKSGLPDVWLTQ